MNTALPQVDDTLLLALIPVAALVFTLVLWALFDIVRRPQTAHLPKAVWALLAILVMPFGAVIYLLIGRGSKSKLSDRDLA
ncbi:PLD nuclease N-terminal domain-containing protein [Leucobacter sp. UT-8R-CII-1-4]|uniref:PLD nuclease N-terminal domain-containing protein n=1 Tax=Leucobacter sp. UT-8R-CII-1-4 TaxID=3040075 RepID=UPI0024A86BD3|nr:PLD nuclease N-terminal domain-containing protein [Leucobacter sp. UT-8R-CII-1-4]MDI6021956.1 PLD nuclease N-terminal domain-containing protein [Leucobacter sp. UT-8R-CII-1-4]